LLALPEPRRREEAIPLREKGWTKEEPTPCEVSPAATAGSPTEFDRQIIVGASGKLRGKYVHELAPAPYASRSLHTRHARARLESHAPRQSGYATAMCRFGSLVDSSAYVIRTTIDPARARRVPHDNAGQSVVLGHAALAVSGLSPFLLIRTGLAGLAFGSGTGHGTLRNPPCLNSPLNVGKRGAFEQHSADAFEGYLTDIPNRNVERGSIVDFYNAYNRIATPDILALFTLYSYDTGPFAGGQRRLKNNYVASSLTYDKLQRSGRRGPMRNHL
jgi:hypothetical protein